MARGSGPYLGPESSSDSAPPTQIQTETIQMYTSWYRRVTRLFVGNPIHQAGGRYVPYAGRHEALVYFLLLLII